MGVMGDVRPLDLAKAVDATAAVVGPEGAGSWMRRVSVVIARRVDGVDVETEYLWEMDDRD
jgi:hypothetical protein